MTGKAKDLIAKTWQETVWQTSSESVVAMIQSLPSSIGVSAVTDIGNAISTQLEIALSDTPLATK